MEVLIFALGVAAGALLWWLTKGRRTAEALQKCEAELVDRQERHQSLFDHAVEGIVTMGEDRVIRSINPAGLKMFGYEKHELVGQNVRVLMPSPDREAHDGYVHEYLKTGHKKIIGIGREVLGMRKDGSTFPLELSVAESHLASGRSFTGILRDVTERKRAEESLRQVNDHLEELVKERTRALEEAQETLVRKERLATLGQLAGSVAHEVRNPLGIVRNAAYYLENTATDLDDDARESHAEIRRGLARADRIITELLDYARDPKTRHAEFSLAEAIRQGLDGLAVPREVTVHVPCPEPDERCHGDVEQVGQILNNLLVNAIQAMPDGGMVSIAWEPTDDAVTVVVTDTGVGMTAEQLEKVFEPLFTTKTRGIGLGLALSQRYAELNGGRLTAESVPGKGATFRFTIPRAPTTDSLPSTDD